MKVYGLLITKDDHEAFGDWCRSELPFYEAVVCLDGSEGDETARQAAEFAEKLVYLRERDFDIPAKTDHGLRRVVHDEIVRRFGGGSALKKGTGTSRPSGHLGGVEESLGASPLFQEPADVWIMCCHTDEFCYHDPRKIAEWAEREGYDLVSWFSPHFYPHPSELADIAERLKRPVQERFAHYHWGYLTSELPWIEDRLYKAGPRVAWDQTTHGSVRPHGLSRAAPFRPILRHYKVCNVDLTGFELDGHATRYRGHWEGQVHRTGLPYRVERVEDFFVAALPKYAHCNRFEGKFDQPWNIGEEFRPYVVRWAGSSEAVHTTPPAPPLLRGGIRRVRGEVDRAIVRDVWDNDEYGVRSLSGPAPKLVVDLGAHIGAFTLLARQLWPGARIVACEADPENAALLRENLAGQESIEIVEAAIVAEDVTETTFSAVPDKEGSNSGGGSCVRPEVDSVRTRVRALSIARLWDQHSLDECDVLKVNCGGSEVSLLRALSDDWRLAKIEHIVGEWHAPDGAQQTTARVREALEQILGETHRVEFSPRRSGREGRFFAQRRDAQAEAIAEAALAKGT